MKAKILLVVDPGGEYRAGGDSETPLETTADAIALAKNWGLEADFGATGYIVEIDAPDLEATFPPLSGCVTATAIPTTPENE